MDAEFIRIATGGEIKKSSLTASASALSYLSNYSCRVGKVPTGALPLKEDAQSGLLASEILKSVFSSVIKKSQLIIHPGEEKNRKLFAPILIKIFNQGTLSTRLRKTLALIQSQKASGSNLYPDILEKSHLKTIYHQLRENLHQGDFFEGLRF